MSEATKAVISFVIACVAFLIGYSALVMLNRISASPPGDSWSAFWEMNLSAIQLLIPIAAGFTAFWLLPSKKRLPPNTCQSCGYNLTGNVSGVCPECGSEVKAS